MDVLREREMKDSLERQLMEEQKTRGKCELLVFHFENLFKNCKSLTQFYCDFAYREHKK